MYRRFVLSNYPSKFPVEVKVESASDLQAIDLSITRVQPLHYNIESVILTYDEAMAIGKALMEAAV